MRHLTPLTTAQVEEAFIRLEAGGTNLRQEALRLHCGSVRLSGALRAEDPVRYARVAQAQRARSRAHLAKAVRARPVYARSAHLPEPPKETPRLRACLGWCGKAFLSWGKANRFCPTCTNRQAHADYERVRGKLQRFKDVQRGGE